MKRQSMFPSILALALLASCASLSNVAPRTELLGDPAPTAAATQAIVITPETRWVNVTGGETVKFIVGDKEFAWNFTVAPSISSFALNRVAPAGIMTRNVVAYVAPDPHYLGGADSEAPGGTN
ncbi:CzcE family metal-binding protein [Massilia cavernae]|uniref:CzcE family metal-binding protein n=1 Tax=Massilia cavernae TaxID=2320864 RepID=A0A418Y6S3_9BURK|nr:CzcE family metal-binding protein [Massilia cavernae]RJG24130.1 hypothetical protein D3872_03725 [Massilia cavernae]